MNINMYTWSVIISAAILGLLVVVFVLANGRHECLSESSFINPRFACGNTSTIDKGEYTTLRNELRDYINQSKEEGKTKLISVFFRDLEAGPTMGINERIDFIPASLLKLPLALAYYSMSEAGEDDMQHQVVFDEVPNLLDQTFDPSKYIEKGKTYSVEELIAHMVTQSDNFAAQLLFEHLLEDHDVTTLNQTYRDLGIIDTGSDFNKEAVNAKSYGSIFRQLYNVSFLGPEYSEKLLTLLSQSEFKDGLKAGVPDTIKVAHKFGERYLNNGEKQLHDCGIVYYPENPYLLCVMTKGGDFAVLKETIAHISSEVYKEVDSRKR